MRGLSRLLTRAGQASPLVPALSYFVVVLITDLVSWLAPAAVAVRFVARAAWILTAILVFVVVTWYRHDDWLAAGFLLGMTMLISAWVAFVVWRTLLTGVFVVLAYRATLRRPPDLPPGDRGRLVNPGETVAPAPT